MNRRVKWICLIVLVTLAAQAGLSFLTSDELKKSFPPTTSLPGSPRRAGAQFVGLKNGAGKFRAGRAGG